MSDVAKSKAQLIAELTELRQRVVQIEAESVKRSQTEEALRESRRFIQQITDTIPYVLYVFDLIQGCNVYASQGITKVTGYTPETIQTMGSQLLENIVHPQDFPYLMENVYKRILEADDNDVIESEYRVRHANGEWRWLRARDVIFARTDEGTPSQILGTALDITEHKKAEEKLHAYQAQLRSLSEQLALTEEQERRQIASDLHDRIGQNLTLFFIKLGEFSETTSDAALIQPLEALQDLVHQTIEDTQSLIFELSPPILYELGLEAAVEWLTEQFDKQYNIHVDFEDDQQPKPLSEELRFFLFKAVRELLINAAKHSQVDRAKVSLQKAGDFLQAVVEDDGVGFDTTPIGEQLNQTGGFGLFNLRERFEHHGGRFQIISTPGCGTRVILQVPLVEST